MRTILYYQTIAENYINGNISDFKKGIKSLSKKDLLTFINIFAEYFYNRETKTREEGIDKANITCHKYL
jgi:hypothetical protein